MLSRIFALVEPTCAPGTSEPPLGLTCALDTDHSVLATLANGWDSIVEPYEHALLRFLSLKERVVFRSVCIEAEHAVSIAPFPTLRRLLRPHQLPGFLASFPTAKVTTLDLNGNYIDDAGTIALAAALPSLPMLTTLYLSLNSIGDAGTIALAAALPSLTALTKLVLCGNYIGDAGTKALAAALPSLTALTTLYLGSNSIGDDGATALAGALPRTLTTLDLGGSFIGDDGATAIARALPSLTALTTLYLGSNNYLSPLARAAFNAAVPIGCIVRF